MITLAVVNNKRGVGKSTIACSLSQALALVGQNVLCVDLDNQRNLTTMLGISDSATQHAIPVDPIFDEIITENKILFLDRLKSSKAVPFIAGLMSEIFPFAEDKLYEDIQDRRNRHLSGNARLHLLKSTENK